MIKNYSVYLIDKKLEEKENNEISNSVTELSYNAKFVSFKHRGKIESLRFFIV